MTSLEMKQGDTWELEVGWFNPSADNPNKPDLTNPIDITGYSARLQIRRSISDNTVAMLDLTDGHGLTIQPADPLTEQPRLGIIAARATPVQTAAVGFGACYWELEIFNDDDNYTLDEGLITVERQLS